MWSLLPKPGSCKDCHSSFESYWASKFLVGLVTSAVFILYGSICIVTQSAYMTGRWGGVEVFRDEATAWGFTLIGAGAFLHFRFFWSNSKFLWRFADMGIVISLLTLIGGIGYLCAKTWISFGN